MKKHIPTLLAEIRATTSWTEKQLAAELDVSQATVSRILSGQKRYRADTYCAVVALHEQKCSFGRRATDTHPGQPAATQDAGSAPATESLP